MIEEMWFNFGKGLKDMFGINGENNQVSLYDNATEISWKQGVDLEEIVRKAGIRRRLVTKLERFSVGGASIMILSPSKEVLKKFSEQDKEEKKLQLKLRIVMIIKRVLLN